MGHRIGALLMAFACCAAPLTAFAQTAYPSHPIKMIVPYSPGGGTDITGRVIAQRREAVVCRDDATGLTQPFTNSQP